jgi:hypothetical protein
MRRVIVIDSTDSVDCKARATKRGERLNRLISQLAFLQLLANVYKGSSDRVKGRSNRMMTVWAMTCYLCKA